jgi:hypothetical protein
MYVLFFTYNQNNVDMQIIQCPYVGTKAEDNHCNVSAQRRAKETTVVSILNSAPIVTAVRTTHETKITQSSQPSDMPPKYEERASNRPVKKVVANAHNVQAIALMSFWMFRVSVPQAVVMSSSASGAKLAAAPGKGVGL